MANKLISTLALTVALAATPATPLAETADKERCYFIAKAGQNDCVNLAVTHSWAGQSSLDNVIGEWKLINTDSSKFLAGYNKIEAKNIYKKV